MCHEAAAMELAMACDQKLSKSLPAVWQPHILEHAWLLYWRHDFIAPNEMKQPAL